MLKSNIRKRLNVIINNTAYIKTASCNGAIVRKFNNSLKTRIHEFN